MQKTRFSVIFASKNASFQALCSVLYVVSPFLCLQTPNKCIFAAHNAFFSRKKTTFFPFFSSFSAL